MLPEQVVVADRRRRVLGIGSKIAVSASCGSAARRGLGGLAVWRKPMSARAANSKFCCSGIRRVCHDRHIPAPTDRRDHQLPPQTERHF
jgi:hypothetical protein